MSDYKSETLKAAQDVDEKDIGLAKTVDAAIVRVKADKAVREKTLRPDQVRDGVKAVSEVVNKWGTSQFTAREIGKMIGYHERNKLGNSVFTEGIKTTEMNYSDTYWDDLRVAITSTKLGGSKDPQFTKFKDNGAGSQGVFTYWFDADAEEEVYFAVQLPHSYKYGTDLHPHVHWTPDRNGGAGEVVSWGLEYCFAEIGEVYGNSNILYGNTHVPADASLVRNQHYLTEIDVISGASIDTVSSMLCCRLFRNATGAGSSTDDFGYDAILLEFDLHYEIDSPGSKTEYAK